jgi:hypothetical protein
MRFLHAERECGPLLELAQLQRQFRLGSPIAEGVATIAVDQIVGTASRAQDFDGCWQPLRKPLERRIDSIISAAPAYLDEPIEVVRVDRAYFVVDGHKRVAIARQSGRVFLDANVSHLPMPYELSTDVDKDAIERTAREGEFRRHTGLADAVPDARFVVTDVSAYGELFEAVQTFAHSRAQRDRRLADPVEVAGDWYRSVYLPTVEVGRERVGGLIDGCTDADVFLAMHRLQRASWGTECDDAECAADMLLLERQRGPRALSTVSRAVQRVRGPAHPPAVLPLAGDRTDSPG